MDTRLATLDALDNLRRGGDGANGYGERSNDAEIETIVEVAADLTSQSRYGLLLQGSPPSDKLLIPLERRDVRVVEGARLESEWGQAYRATPKQLFRQREQRFSVARCSAM